MIELKDKGIRLCICFYPPHLKSDTEATVSSAFIGSPVDVSLQALFLLMACTYDECYKFYFLVD